MVHSFASIDPELAQVGMTEAQACKRPGDAVAVVRRPDAVSDRAQTERSTEDMLKRVAGRRGHALDASILGVLWANCRCPGWLPWRRI